jgi:hypothetical protein
MLNEVVHLVPYALLAALSPLGFAATIAVMGSGRLKALGFTIGFVGGQLLALAIVVVIGSAALPDHKQGYPTFRAILEICFGAALLWAAVHVQRRPPAAHAGPNERSQAALDRLGRMRVGTAAAAGLVLGIGGPKRLVLTAIAAASITASGVGGSEEAALVCWYAILATSLVWASVLAFEFFGDSAIGKFTEAQRWLARHQKQAVVYPLVLLGLLLIADGLLLVL